LRCFSSLSYRPSFSAPWVALALVPWVAGAFILWWSPTATTASARLAQQGSAPAVRIAWLVLCGFGFLVAWILGPIAAIYLLVWAGAASLILVSVGRDAVLRDLVVGAAVAAVATSLALGSAELLLRVPRIAQKIGSPQERFAAWNARYDRLWERNIFHFRYRYETIARRPGVTRILVMGDSYTFGYKIAETDSTWPPRLERLLESAVPTHDFEVISAAQLG
jgi:hypothetical protein